MKDDRLQNDHDLLIALHEQMKGMRNDIKELKDNLAGRVSKLEDEKAEKTATDKTLTEHNERITWLERIAYGGLAILAAIQFYLTTLS